MRTLILSVFMLLLIAPLAWSFDSSFDHMDKMLFTGLAVAQVTDGLTTIDNLKNGHKINGLWEWKYGSSRPSDTRIWVTKAAEVGIAYIVANKLSSKPRKVFLLGATALLLYCGINNGLQFSITY